MNGSLVAAAALLGAVGVVGLMVIADSPEGRFCIQEVKQGRTLSRELGQLTRDPRTGYFVCSRTL